MCINKQRLTKLKEKSEQWEYYTAKKWMQYGHMQMHMFPSEK